MVRFMPHGPLSTNRNSGSSQPSHHQHNMNKNTLETLVALRETLIADLMEYEDLMLGATTSGSWASYSDKFYQTEHAKEGIDVTIEYIKSRTI